MLLDAILQMHAWASGRFKHKTQLEGQKLENQNLRIIKTEAEQGMCSPTPSSSTSAFSFSSSVSKFRYRAIGIVGMLRLPSKFCLESAMCYLLFFFLELAGALFSLYFVALPNLDCVINADYWLYL